MTSPAAPDTLVASTAATQAAQAAARADVRLLPLDTLAAVRDAADLFARVWKTDATTPPLASDVMRAVEHAGGYVVGAYADGVLVGASSGFLGIEADRRPVLHSHISGVLQQGRAVGLALKLHQRAWALERGILAITWTFDPLVRRNAWFNLVKLGATGVEYLPDFYGPMSDGVNGGESSDRLFTRWDLAGTAPGPLDAAGAVLLLDDAAGAPAPTSTSFSDASMLTLRLPADIESLRTTAPASATAWRLAVRRLLVPAFADGFTVRGMTSDACLVLAR
ncbi:MAG: GNAT family N-acetyltransferase [Actinobacteria bacterium]|nr:GNAT family N-acetyltransferase [Actinomycetota bacterium]MCA1721735.1 GNAT family N-acetyltransferase [Actinomycetota bacterium]